MIKVNEYYNNYVPGVDLGRVRLAYASYLKGSREGFILDGRAGSKQQKEYLDIVLGYELIEGGGRWLSI